MVPDHGRYRSGHGTALKAERYYDGSFLLDQARNCSWLVWCRGVINEHWETDSGFPADVHNILILLYFKTYQSGKCFTLLVTVSKKRISSYLLTLQ